MRVASPAVTIWIVANSMISPSMLTVVSPAVSVCGSFPVEVSVMTPGILLFGILLLGFLFGVPMGTPWLVTNVSWLPSMVARRGESVVF